MARSGIPEQMMFAGALSARHITGIEGGEMPKRIEVNAGEEPLNIKNSHKKHTK